MEKVMDTSSKESLVAEIWDRLIEGGWTKPSTPSNVISKIVEDFILKSPISKENKNVR